MLKLGPALPSPPQPSVHELYAVTPEGPRRLDVPASIEDPTRVFDSLPRGIYEALRTFDHVRFVGLQEHVERAERSMASLGLPGPLDRGALRRALHAVVSEFPADETRVRFDVLAGPAAAYGSQERVLVQAADLVLPRPEDYRDGVRVSLTGEVRRRRPAVKEAQWVVDRRAATARAREGGDPILVDERGRLLEGVQSNLFLVRDGALWTAPTAGVLAGVTRRFLIGLAEEAGIEVREEFVHESEIATLDEAFFTTSVRGVLPVVGVGDATIGDGRPGAVTRRLMESYAEHCARVARPAIDAI